MKSLLVSLYEYSSIHDNHNHNQRSAISQQYVPMYPLCDNRAVFAFSQYNRWRTECKLLTFFSFFFSSLILFFNPRSCFSRLFGNNMARHYQAKQQGS